MPQNSNFRLLRGHWFFEKNGSYGYGANYGGDPLGSILRPMGSHWVQKMGQNRKKLPCPKIRIFDYSAVIDFSQKRKLRLWRQIMVRTLLGPFWGPMGPHWVKKWVKAIKNTMPQNSNFRLSRGHRFLKKKWKLRLWRQITVVGPSWGQWGPIGSKKWVTTVKNYHAT